MNAVEAKQYGLVDDVLGDTSDVIVINKKGEIGLASGTAIEDKSSNGVPAAA
jgi:hypothetical protein